MGSEPIVTDANIEPIDPSTQEQMDAFGKALAVFVERNSLRGDDWRDKPLERHLNNIEQKVDRLRMIAKMGRRATKADLDEAIDIINYGAFAARNIAAELDAIYESENLA